MLSPSARSLDAVEACTILTTAANETVAPVHGHIPVILPPHVRDARLAGEDVPLHPYPAGDMTAWPVSTHVNRPANDDPRCVEPISLI
ncbi:MAG: SOS response-associated peptidase family protein [Acidobacteria bacterium]|nr:SOS response-associated peptidase family protein [Acidobacteriota bacterium]